MLGELPSSESPRCRRGPWRKLATRQPRLGESRKTALVSGEAVVGPATTTFGGATPLAGDSTEQPGAR